MLAAVVAVAACVFGCDPLVNATFSSRTYPTGAAPIERLLVVARVKSRAFDDSMSQGFETGLVRRLGVCGVQSRVMYNDGMDLDFEQRMSEITKEFQPGAAMEIKALGGDIYSTNGTVTNAHLLFELKILYLESNQLTWLARSAFDFHTGSIDEDAWNAGVEFATHIISRIRDDGVLPHCPAAGTRWPELDFCREGRRRKVEEIKHVRDDRERRLLLEALPVCMPSR